MSNLPFDLREDNPLFFTSPRHQLEQSSLRFSNGLFDSVRLLLWAHPVFMRSIRSNLTYLTNLG